MPETNRDRQKGRIIRHKAIKTQRNTSECRHLCAWVSWWREALQLTAVAGDFVGRTGATGTVAGFCLGRLAWGTTLAQGVTRHTHNPLKLFGFAFGASELYLLFLVPYEELKAIIAFQTPEFINRHHRDSFNPLFFSLTF